MSARSELIEYALGDPTAHGLEILIGNLEREIRDSTTTAGGVVARRGDTLVVGMSTSGISDERYRMLTERYQPLTESGVKVFLIEQASSLAVIRGPELDVNGAPLTRTLADDNVDPRER